MSEVQDQPQDQAQDQERKETAKERKARLAAETAANGQEGQEGTEGPEEAKETKPRQKAPDTSNVSLDSINAATLAVADLVNASAPMRERSEQQKAMDAVAVKAYNEWVKADRPSVWQKMPVVTYFLSTEDVPKYRYLIRRACSIVEPVEGYPSVRVRFGNEFTLSETMAGKIGRPDDAGKTVLAWAAVEKRSAEDKPEEK